MFPSLVILFQLYSAAHSSSSKRLNLRRLDVTVGDTNVRTCVTLWSVCLRTCQVTACIRFPGQLNYDRCTPAVKLWFHPHQFCLERITSFVAAQAGPNFAFVNLCLIMDNRSQLRSCHNQRLSVSNHKECKPTSIHRLSELNVLIIHIHLHSILPEHVANAFTYDNKHTLQIRITRWYADKFHFTGTILLFRHVHLAVKAHFTEVLVVALALGGWGRGKASRLGNFRFRPSTLVPLLRTHRAHPLVLCVFVVLCHSFSPGRWPCFFRCIYSTEIRLLCNFSSSLHDGIFIGGLCIRGSFTGGFADPAALGSDTKPTSRPASPTPFSDQL